MARTLIVALILLAGCAVRPARSHAVGTVDLSWNVCSPIEASLQRGAPGPVVLFASVIGQELPHRAYQLRLFVSSSSFVVPDAWRFDPVGCQGTGRIRMEAVLPAPLEACPQFQGPGTSFQIRDFSFDGATGVSQIFFANAYPGGVAAPDPLVRSLLVRFLFDHSASIVGPGTGGGPGVPGDACGGFENNMVLSFDRPYPCQYACDPYIAQWADMNNEAHDFALGQRTVTFCGSCEPVPAVASTWGAIKGQYRR